MASLGNFTKQPRERLPVDISFGTFIGTRTATSITPAIEVPSGLTVEQNGVNNNVLQLFISSGTSGVIYKVVILTTIVISAQSHIIEDYFNVLVEES